jgi:integrase
MPRRGKRGNGEGTVYQRKDGRWVAEVFVGYRPNGNPRQVQRYAKTQREALAKLDELRREQAKGAPIDVKRHTVAEFLTRWLEHSVKPARRPSTCRNYEIYVRRHLIPALGRHRLTKLSPQHVQDMINAKVAAGLNPKTIQNIRGTLRRGLNQAMRWELVGRNVATLVDLPKADTPEVDPLELDEALRFLEVLQGDRLEGLFAVTLMTGLRRGEALGLRGRTWTSTRRRSASATRSSASTARCSSSI